MDKNLVENIQLIKGIKTDDSNFILKVFESYQKNKLQIEKQKQLTTIVLHSQILPSHQNIINLDKIVCSKNLSDFIFILE